MAPLEPSIVQGLPPGLHGECIAFPLPLLLLLLICVVCCLLLLQRDALSQFQGYMVL
jgi:hydrogenase-4 membrane subunit HyfE